MRSFQELTVEELLEKAEKITEKYYEEGSLPVQIEEIIDTAGLDIIPATGLKDLDINAGILSDFSSILVDSKQYMDEKCLNGVRFSLAHEFGHFVLHRDIFEQDSACLFFHDLIVKQNKLLYKKIEEQANLFARFLLVPEREFDKAMQEGKEPAELSRIFRVSTKCIKKRTVTYLKMHNKEF